MKFNFVPQTFFRIFFFRIRIRIMSRIKISLWNSLEKVILYMLKISTKYGVAAQSFCEKLNFVQNQDQDHDITLNFDTRRTFYTWKTLTKFCLDPLTPSKVIVSTWKVHVRTARQPDRQTDRRKFFFLVLSSKTYKTWTFVKRRIFFFTHAITILSLFTYSVCDEKVIIGIRSWQSAKAKNYEWRSLCE